MFKYKIVWNKSTQILCFLFDKVFENYKKITSRTFWHKSFEQLLFLLELLLLELLLLLLLVLVSVIKYINSRFSSSCALEALCRSLNYFEIQFDLSALYALVDLLLRIFKALQISLFSSYSFLSLIYKDCKGAFPFFWLAEAKPVKFW